jgi:uncharacterized glyoxalase superfamily protein PhnB
MSLRVRRNSHRHEVCHCLMPREPVAGKELFSTTDPIYISGNVRTGHRRSFRAKVTLASVRLTNFLEMERIQMAEASKSVKNRVQSYGNQLSHAAASAAENVVAVADDVSSRTQEFITDATEQAENAGAYLSQRADEATVAVGGQLKAAGNASETMAQRLKESGKYLQKEGFEGICTDVASVIKNNPISSMLMGAGLGFLMARALYRHES